MIDRNARPQVFMQPLRVDDDDLDDEDELEDDEDGNGEDDDEDDEEADDEPETWQVSSGDHQIR